MPIGPKGAGIEGPASDDETSGTVGGAEREYEGHGGAGARACRNLTPECQRRPRSPENPNPINELIAALREAVLDPVIPGRHGLDPPRERPRVKIQPQFLKECQVKDLTRIC